MLQRVAGVAAVAMVATCCLGMMRQDGDAQRQRCTANLKQVDLALLMYVQDYDECYPPMKFASQIQPRLYPYTKDRGLFRCPATGADYLPNPALNYVSLASIENPATTIALCDAKPHTEQAGISTWTVAYADGHVATVDTQPKLGKPAPTPPTLSHAQQVREELVRLRLERTMIENRIKKLESEQRRLKAKR